MIELPDPVMVSGDRDYSNSYHEYYYLKSTGIVVCVMLLASMLTFTGFLSSRYLLSTYAKKSDQGYVLPSTVGTAIFFFIVIMSCYLTRRRHSYRSAFFRIFPKLHFHYSSNGCYESRPLRFIKVHLSFSMSGAEQCLLSRSVITKKELLSILLERFVPGAELGFFLLMFDRNRESGCRVSGDAIFFDDNDVVQVLWYLAGDDRIQKGVYLDVEKNCYGILAGKLTELVEPVVPLGVNINR